MTPNTHFSRTQGSTGCITIEACPVDVCTKPLPETDAARAVKSLLSRTMPSRATQADETTGNAETVSLSKYREMGITCDLLNLVPNQIAWMFRMFPVALSGGVLTVAIGNPAAAAVVNQLPCVTDGRVKSVETVLADSAEIRDYTMLYYGTLGDFDNPSPEVAAIVKRRVTMEAVSFRGNLVAGVKYHPVVAALHQAFCDHRPVRLSPDMIWLLIAQALANHINANAERLRHVFVSHEGKMTISVQRDDFVKGSADNPWPLVFTAFSHAVGARIPPEFHDLLRPTFSTTGPVERAAFEIVLLDSMQSCFEYEFMSLCGIPRIYLEGTPDDWQHLRTHAEKLSSFGLGLDWWMRLLLPILDQFVAAAQGNPDRGFWQSIYKLNNRSGGPDLRGWILAFFPYLRNAEDNDRSTRINPYLQPDEFPRDMLCPSERHEEPDCGLHGPNAADLPCAVSCAPFTWKYQERKFDMEFLAGFVGIEQCAEDLALRPKIGWVVRDVS